MIDNDYPFNVEYDFRDDYLSDSEFELDKILSLQL